MDSLSNAEPVKQEPQAGLAYAETVRREPSIGLIGAGPVGGLLATCLAENGHSFYWAERNRERRLWARGFAARHPKLRIEVGRGSSEFGRISWLILAVKSHQVEGALFGVGVPDVFRTLVVANGLVEGGDYLGLLYGGARLEGELVLADTNRILVGPVRGEEDASSELVELLACAQLVVQRSTTMRARQWHKLAMNCVVNPLTVLHDCLNGELLPMLGSPEVAGILAELHAVAAVELGAAWTYTPERLHVDLAELIRATASNSSSMREDTINGRTTEISHLNLAVVRVGRCHGIACPINDNIGRMVSSLANRGAIPSVTDID